MSTHILTLLAVNSCKRQGELKYLLTTFQFFVWGYVQVCLIASQSVGGSQRSNLFTRVPEVCRQCQSAHMSKMRSGGREGSANSNSDRMKGRREKNMRLACGPNFLPRSIHVLIHNSNEQQQRCPLKSELGSTWRSRSA